MRVRSKRVQPVESGQGREKLVQEIMDSKKD